MSERTIPTPLLWTSILLDLLMVLIFLFMPRSGMEEMATAFLLIPLTVARILTAIIVLALAIRRRAWRFGLYTMVAVAAHGWFWFVGLNLKPTYEPLHQVLRQEAKAQASRLGRAFHRLI